MGIYMEMQSKRLRKIDRFLQQNLSSAKLSLQNFSLMTGRVISHLILKPEFSATEARKTKRTVKNRISSSYFYDSLVNPMAMYPKL